MFPPLTSTQLAVPTPKCTDVLCDARANARVVARASRTGAAIYAFTGDRMPVRDWSPRTNILSLRYMATLARYVAVPLRIMAKKVRYCEPPYNSVTVLILVLFGLSS